MPTERTPEQTISSLRRRLERWELNHLRELAAELRARLDRAEAETAHAWSSAEFWQGNAQELQEALAEADFTVGITKEGQMMARAPYSHTVYSCSCGECSIGESSKDQCLCNRDINLSKTMTANSGALSSTGTVQA